MKDLTSVGIITIPTPQSSRTRDEWSTGQEEVQAEVAIYFSFVLYNFRTGSGSRVYSTQLIWEVMSAMWGGSGGLSFLKLVLEGKT